MAVGVAAAAVMAASCAKSSTATSTNEGAKKYFEAWIRNNYPKAEQTPMGYYVLENTEGSGDLVGNMETTPYLISHFTSRELDGSITSSTSEQMAKQLGQYKESNYYGPKVIYRADGSFFVGLDDAVSTMRVGGHKKVAVPGWLLNTERRANIEDYFLKEKDIPSPGIYEFDIVDVTKDINQWQIDSIERYMLHNPETMADSVRKGQYFKRLKEPTDTTAFEETAAVYISYVGRLLNGTVFDTNIRDTAKYYHIYKEGGKYEPVAVTWNTTTYSKMTMGGSESGMIDGFAFAIHRMRTGEKAMTIFYSDFGYASSGSGSAIPSYSPLRFDIEVIGVMDK